MDLHPSKTYHPYHDYHPRDIVHLRYGRTYQRRFGVHPNDLRRRHQNRLKAMKRCSWDSLSPELQYNIVTITLYDDGPLTISKISRYARICRSWRLHVARYLYHDETDPIRLLFKAVEKDISGVASVLINRPDLQRRPLRAFELNNLLHIAVTTNALDVITMIFQKTNVSPNRCQRNNLVQDAAKRNFVDVTRMLLEIFNCRRCSIDMELLLHYAVRGNAVDVVKMLVNEHHMNVIKIIPCLALEPAYKRVWTALHTACFHGHVEMVRFIVEEFDVLKDKSQQYVNDLARLALNNNQGIMFLEIVRFYGADLDCM